MMSGGGHMMALTQRLPENRKLLHRKKIFDKLEGFLAGQKKLHKAPKENVVIKKISAAKLQKIRLAVHQRSKKQWKYFLSRLSIALLILIIVRSFAINAWNSGAFNPYRPYSEAAQFKNQEEKRKADYLFFSIDGDKYIQEKHWNNAKFQYKKALELYPHEYDANLRLVIAYSYKCMNEGLDCTTGQLLIEKLLSQQPNNADLKEIAIVLLTESHTNK